LSFHFHELKSGSHRAQNSWQIFYVGTKKHDHIDIDKGANWRERENMEQDGFMYTDAKP